MVSIFFALMKYGTPWRIRSEISDTIIPAINNEIIYTDYNFPGFQSTVRFDLNFTTRVKTNLLLK